LARVRAYLAREPRLIAFQPDGGNVMFPRLPARVDTDRLVRHLVSRYSTLVVPGRFFEAPRHIRISFGCRPSRLARGLANISRARLPRAPIDDEAPRPSGDRRRQAAGDGPRSTARNDTGVPCPRA